VNFNTVIINVHVNQSVIRPYESVSNKMCQTSGCYYMNHFDYKCSINVCPIVNLYNARGILMYLHTSNRKLYRICIFHSLQIKKNISDNLTKERHSVSVYYCTPQKKNSSDFVFGFCLYVIKSMLRRIILRKKDRFLFILRSWLGLFIWLCYNTEEKSLFQLCCIKERYVTFSTVQNDLQPYVFTILHV
jgi:hypothetical protein